MSKTPTETKELVKTTGTKPVSVLSAEDMALMQGAAHSTDAKAGDLMIPYLTIVQSMSGYVKQNDPAYIPEAREGDLIDTLTLKLRNHADFVVSKYETHYTTWGPNRGRMIAQHFTDATAYEAARWRVDRQTGKELKFGPKTDAQGNDVVPQSVYYGLLVTDAEQGFTQPCIVALAGTQQPKSRRWNSLINFEMIGNDGQPFVAANFARIYRLSTGPESSVVDGQVRNYSGWKIEPGPLTVTQQPFGRAWFAKALAFRKAVEDGLVRPMPTRNEEGVVGQPVAGQQRAGDTDDIPF